MPKPRFISALALILFCAAAAAQENPLKARPRLLYKADPEYPERARESRIHGVVRYTVVIGKDGRVERARLIRGHPLLVAAANDAVRQYVFEPTLLNGEPIEVISEVVIPFVLGRTYRPPSLLEAAGFPSGDAPRIGVAAEVQAKKLLSSPSPVVDRPPDPSCLPPYAALWVFIGPDGRVRDTRWISGNLELRESAERAIRNWVYSPTVVNGRPAEVVTRVFLNHFMLRPSGAVDKPRPH